METLDIVHASNHALKKKEIVILIINVKMVIDVDPKIVKFHTVLALTQIAVMYR